jgi:cleavage and polyadenylation specificity factor subunit 1
MSWGDFAYKKMFFGFKNVGDTFQRAMSFAFHDLNHIVEAYLDDFIVRSRKTTDHLVHIKIIFERCRYYHIRLNLNKCMFCIVSGCLLGFIVSNKGIMVDPLKAEAIVQLSPSHNIRQLQSLQGKANFLQRFITNYVDFTKGFMCLLKKGVPSVCDEFAQ